MEKIILTLCALGFIVTQIPHTNKVFFSISRLDTEKSKAFQAWTLSILTSIMIAVFIYIDNILMAGIGVAIEIVINVYYYTQEYWLDKWWINRPSTGKPKFIWHHRFMELLFSVLIPVMIFIISLLIHNE